METEMLHAIDIVKYEPISAEQLKQLEEELIGEEELIPVILECFHIKNLADISNHNFHASIKRIREIKNHRIIKGE